MKKTPVIELKNITKRFAKVLDNYDVSMTINKGEVVALLGENGAGKSTIMKILFGLYNVSSGEIYVDGKKQHISSPQKAMDLGISMIQQHFSLVEAHTVTENIILGTCKGKIDFDKEATKIQKLVDTYNFEVSVKAKVGDLPVGIQQKVEILKALYRDSRVLIMDEPTAVLIPQEAEILMEFIRQFVAVGNSVIFITHKMKEVLEVADRIIVMKDGCISGSIDRDQMDSIGNDKIEKELARMMIGHDLEILSKGSHVDYDHDKKRLEVHNLNIKHGDTRAILEDISFDIYDGEVFAIAGVSGNGQVELCEAIYGAVKVDEGSIKLDGEDITHATPVERIAGGIGYCASDRFRYGMVAQMSLAENMFLKSSYMSRWQKHGIISWKRINEYTEDMIEVFSVKAPDHTVSAASLSGGNQQKLVLAREVGMGSKLIICDQPTRGLDLGAINYVHKTILAEKESGKSILLVSTELSEIFEMADRIAVMYQGRFMGIYKSNELNTEKIGLLMAGCSIDKEEIHDK